MYSAAPVSCGGTKPALSATAALTAERKSSSGTGGHEMNAALCCIRLALRSGRKMVMDSSPGVRKALSPS
jgi:hypothetical protein